MSKLQKRLKKIPRMGKYLIFICIIFFTTFNEIHAQITIQDANSFIDKKTTTTYKKTSEHYELKNGVLMPNAGESKKAYEARRLRLKKEEKNLRKLIPQDIPSQVAPLKEQNIDKQVIDLVENALKEQSSQPLFISYYSAEGRKRLKNFKNK